MKRFSVFGSVVVVLFSVLGATALLLMHPTVQLFATRQLLGRLSGQSGFTLSVDRVRVALDGNVRIEGATLSQPDGLRIVEVARADSRVDLLALLRRRLKVDQISLYGVELTLREDPDGELSITTFGRSFGPGIDGDPDPDGDVPRHGSRNAGFSLRFARVAIVDATVIYESHRLRTAIIASTATILADVFTVSQGVVAADITSISIVDILGVPITDGALTFSLASGHMDFQRLWLINDDSRVRGRFTMDSAGEGGDGFSDPDSRIEIELLDTRIGTATLEKVSLSAPGIRLDHMGDVRIQLAASGSPTDLTVTALNIQSGDTLKLRASGSIARFGDDRRPSFEAEIESLRFTREDLEALNSGRVLAGGLKVPDRVEISGSVAAGARGLSADLSANTSDGDWLLMANITRQDVPAVKGRTIGAELQGYAISASVIHDEDAVDIELEAEYAAGPDGTSVRSSVVVNSLRPHRFGFLLDDTVVSGTLSLETEFSSWSLFDLSMYLEAMTLTDHERVYRVEGLSVSAGAGSGQTSVEIESSYLNASLRSSVALNEISDNLTQHLTRYFTPADSDLPERPGGTIDFRFDLTEPFSILVPLIPALSELSPIAARVLYDGNSGELRAEAFVERVGYAGVIVEELAGWVTSGPTTLLYDIGAVRVILDQFSFFSPVIVGDARGDAVTAGVSLDAEDHTDLLRAGLLIRTIEDGFTAAFVPNQITLGSAQWDIPSGHSVSLRDGVLRIDNFQLTRNNESIRVQSRHRDDDSVDATAEATFNRFESSRIDVQISELNLVSVLRLAGAETENSAGVLNGSIRIHVDVGAPVAVKANLDAQGLVLDGRRIGTATVVGSVDRNRLVELSATVEQDENSASMSGRYDIQTSEGEFVVELNHLDIDYLSGYLPDELSQTRGSIGGRITARGSLLEPVLAGEISFRNAGFAVSRLGTSFSIGDDRITIDRNLLRFSSFRVLDRRGNPATVDGTVRLSPDPSSVHVDLSIDSRSFTILNTTARINPRFYGVLNIDSRLRLRGSLSDVTAEGSIGLVSRSSVTLVLPEGGASAGDASGIVRFVDSPQSPTQAVGIGPALFRGIDLTTTLVVDSDTSVELVVDQRSGDRLRMRGGGDLSLGISPGGAITLSGEYRINQGTYLLSFFNVTRREFAIQSGSTVVWRGDPLDATLDVRATYTVRASPMPLIMPQPGDRQEQDALTGELPFLVVLTMSGNLIQPEVSFSLDMPVAQRTGAGATAYAIISQINQEESRRNTQAFSLIVLNQFVSDDLSGIDETAVFSAGARTSASRLLTYQLNALSARFISGIDVSFIVDSYEEFTEDGPEGRTEVQVEVSRRLLNERLIVRLRGQIDVEGERSEQTEWTELAGDISVEYLLTRDGRYRVRAFRERGYEGPLDGSLTTTGVSFVFTQSFNRFQLPKILRKEDDQ